MKMKTIQVTEETWRRLKVLSLERRQSLAVLVEHLVLSARAAGVVVEKNKNEGGGR